MSITIQDILQRLNHERDALTGGALAPAETNAAGATAATGNGTGGALAPDAAAAEDRLAKALKSLGQNAVGDRWSGLERFGGKVLGFGEHQSDAMAGHTGKFAVVQRGGDLWHVYRDGFKTKVDQGAVARTLGIKPKVADLVPVLPQSNGTGGAMAPAMPGTATPRGSDPLDELRRLLHSRA